MRKGSYVKVEDSRVSHLKGIILAKKWACISQCKTFNLGEPGSGGAHL